ncbi:MAG: hypothetical protein GYA55_11380 [SAR324 cluster bacterium]|uniref:Uncharacterized protein n=1 Tax=SAR324 cluster bacterium TaxID=2024889 RepID=A0A7X9FT27_9DELT|nr:hypothetical protein [SAR324 cluster bacterium]
MDLTAVRQPQLYRDFIEAVKSRDEWVRRELRLNPRSQQFLTDLIGEYMELSTIFSDSELVNKLSDLWENASKNFGISAKVDLLHAFAKLKSRGAEVFYDIADEIVDSLIKDFSEMENPLSVSHIKLSFLANALVRLRIKDPYLGKLICESFKKDQRKAQPIDLFNMSKFFILFRNFDSTTNPVNLEHISCLKERSLPLLNELDARSIVSILRAVAFYDSTPYSFFEVAVPVLMQRLGGSNDITIETMMNAVRALSTLHVIDKALLGTVSCQLSARLRVLGPNLSNNEKYELVYLLGALANLNYRDSSLVDVIGPIMCDSTQMLGPFETLWAMWSFSVFGERDYFFRLWEDLKPKLKLINFNKSNVLRLYRSLNAMGAGSEFPECLEDFLDSILYQKNREEPSLQELEEELTAILEEHTKTTIRPFFHIASARWINVNLLGSHGKYAICLQESGDMVGPNLEIPPLLGEEVLTQRILQENGFKIACVAPDAWKALSTYNEKKEFLMSLSIM